MSQEELEKLLLSWGEKPFHAAQVRRWLYHSLVTSFDRMSDLPATLRRKLEAETDLLSLKPLKQEKSTDGLTTKALLALPDGLSVESVDMRQGVRASTAPRRTICVSTQVGCPIRCPFCATGRQGFARNLSAGEIAEQVLYFACTYPSMPVTNVVFMGMGEPLINYDATLGAARILNEAQGFNLGARRMTISTAGVVPGIKRLATESLQVGLAVSLHAPDNQLRDALVPLNRRYPVEQLLSACREYFAATSRRVTFEYVLLDRVNDSMDHAVRLSMLLRKLDCHVNLIRANAVAGNRYSPSPREQALRFESELRRHGIAATLRRSLGADIQGGCGQLSSQRAAKVRK